MANGWRDKVNKKIDQVRSDAKSGALGPGGYVIEREVEGIEKLQKRAQQVGRKNTSRKSGRGD